MSYISKIQACITLPNFHLVQFNQPTLDRVLIEELWCRGYKPLHVTEQENLINILNFKGVVAFQSKPAPEIKKGIAESGVAFLAKKTNLERRIFDRMFVKSGRESYFMDASFCDSTLGYENPHSMWSQEVYFLVQPV